MSRIVRNTTAVSVAFVSNTVLTFVQLKLLTRYLPQADLGEYYTTWAIGALVSVLAQVGLPMVVLRFTAKYDALGDMRRVGNLVRLGWGIVAGLSVLLLALEWVVLPQLLPRIYDEPPATTNVLLATGVFVVVALRQITYAGFDGLRRMVYPAVFENVNIAIITTLIVLARHQLTLPMLFGFSLGSGLLIFFLASVRLRTEMRRPGSGGAGAEPGDARPPAEPARLLPDISPFWSGAALNSLVGICLGYADKLLISLFLSFQLVSIFVIAERLTFLTKRLLALALQVASPEITRRWELGRREELRHDLGFMVKLQLAVGVLVAAVVCAMAEAAVLAISRSEFLDAAGLLRVLSVSVVMMAFYSPITTFMRAIERINLALTSDIIWIVLYLATGAALVPRFGLAGIVWAQVAASATTLVYNVVVGRRVARIVWDVRGMLRIAGFGAVLAVAGYLAAGVVPVLAEPVVALACAFLFNVLIVRSGALSVGDRSRLRELSGGTRVGRIVDRLLFWPLGAPPPPSGR